MLNHLQNHSSKCTGQYIFPLADCIRSRGCAAALSPAAAKSVLVEDFGVGCVIHSYGGAHTLSPQKSTSEGCRLLQNHEAVAMETALEPVRRCHIVQDLSEPWSETEKHRKTERKWIERIFRMLPPVLDLRDTDPPSEGPSSSTPGPRTGWAGQGHYSTETVMTER